MLCKSCNSLNREIAKYCKTCGEEIILLENDWVSNDIIQHEFFPLVGVDDLKRSIFFQLQGMRNMRKSGFGFDIKDLNSILIGDTGTGKTTAVYVLAKLFYKYGFIKDANPVIISAANFAEFALDIAENLKNNKGHLLCIENVNQLVPDGYHAGQTTLMDKLYAELDKSGEKPIIILTARNEGFVEYLKANPNVSNRFHNKFYLPDFHVDQLFDIAEYHFKNQNVNLTAAFENKLKSRLLYLFRKQRDPEAVLQTGRNGFIVLKELQQIFQEHFKTSPKASNITSFVLNEEDIKGALQVSKSPDQVIAELDDFVGMHDVKDYLLRLIQVVKRAEEDAEKLGNIATFGTHLVLTGNPGTGKTTVARKLGELFTAAGLLTSGHIIEVDRGDIVGQYLGETSKLVKKYCDEAMGGILLIDEAYTLKQDSGDQYGQEAIDTLLKRMEDDRGKFVVIATGYQSDMQRFISSNPGLKSRFQDNFFHLSDYSPEELYEIFKIFVKQQGFVIEEEAVSFVQKRLKRMYEQRTKDFGNGRDVRTFFEQTLTNRAARLASTDETYSNVLKKEDVLIDNQDISEDNIEDIMARLNRLTGLEGVKQEVNMLVDQIEIDKYRKNKIPISLHTVFTGNPGTGKTTVARLLAEVYKHLGVLSKGHLVEVTDKDLIAEYVGQTSNKTNIKIDEAMGGVLFIDEAYTLTVKNPNDTFKAEAVATLLKRMEDDRGKFIVIAAGYSDDMNDFLNSNAGLESRFTRKIHFEDYDVDSLLSIALQMLSDADFRLSPDSKKALLQKIQAIYDNRDNNFANARAMRTLFEHIYAKQSTRLSLLRKQGLTFDVTEVLAEDIVDKEEQEAKLTLCEIMDELNNLTGLEGVKSEVRDLVNFIQIEAKRQAMGSKKNEINLHTVFTGNPGTGKTTVARILANIYKHLGILSKGHLVEVTDKDLIGEYMGQTSRTTDKKITEAMGGVLFIDEAYTLTVKNKQDSFKAEAIAALLKRMEDDRGKFIVIAAGYDEEMGDFLNSNSGLESRFTRKINFKDYQPNALFDILKNMFVKSSLHLTEAAEMALKNKVQNIFENRDEKFANARTMRNEFENILRRQSNRLNDDAVNSDVLEIIEQDILSNN